MRLLFAYSIILVLMGCAAGSSRNEKLFTGHVIDPNGKPVAHATVGIDAPGRHRNVNTNRNGAFHFNKASLADGLFSIKAKNFCTLRIQLAQGWNWLIPDQYDLELTLCPQPKLYDKAGTGTLEGHVVDDKSQAIPGAWVHAEGGKIGAACDGKGTYRITNIPAGGYTFTAQSVGYTKTAVESLIIPPDTVLHVDFILFVWPLINHRIR